jgi:aerobic-type carbon monoxide dehydrogenase small subunit (CoxS/CutS family)
MLIRLTVNQRDHDVEVLPGLSLLTVLRDDLDLTGTRYGCGHGVCGACVVMVDSVATPSCQLTVEEAAGASILTIEGLARNGTLHRVQRAFVEEDAMQCGYCTSGMIMTAAAFLSTTPSPTIDQAKQALAGNICRCGTHTRILRAVVRAAKA